MIFASPTFLFFFLPAVCALYLLCRGMAAKNVLLLGASLVFYAWGEPLFVLVMLAMTLFNWAAAIGVDRLDGRRRGLALAGAIAVNLSVLAAFKYLGFLAGSWNALAPDALAVPAVEVPLPLGISFFTFHCLSYLIDVARRRFAANRSLPQVALYIAFFPQLIAGPIVRYNTIARRLRRRRHSLGRASAGLRLFVIGLAQKTLIADQLAPLAEAVFDKTAKPALAEAWTGTLAYTLQIYFDFAGYSLMAIGLGVVFGFSLPRNFRTPYASHSIAEFWRRWHISLSSWFRDYLYIPLGGNRGGRLATARNLTIVFLLCGLWHGAAWTFVLWGLWHGLFLSLERLGLGRLLKRAPPLAWGYAILVVMLGWVLFRAPGLDRALEVWAGLLGMNGTGGFGPELGAAWSPLHVWLTPLAAALAILPGLVRLRLPRLRPLAIAADHLAVVVLLLLGVLQVAAGAYSPFLYFRF